MIFFDSCDSYDCECDLIVNEVVAGAVWKRKEKKVRKKGKEKKATRDVTSNLVPVVNTDWY